MISIKVVLVSGFLRVRDEFDEKFFFFLERDQTSSFGEVNTSDLSGNDSSDGSRSCDIVLRTKLADSRSGELPPTLFVHRPPVAPGRRLGQEIEVFTNALAVTDFPQGLLSALARADAAGNIYHLDVVIDPDVPPAINREVMAELERAKGAEVFGGTKCVYDGRKNLFAPRPLPYGTPARPATALIAQATTVAGSCRCPRRTCARARPRASSPSRSTRSPSSRWTACASSFSPRPRAATRSSPRSRRSTSSSVTSRRCAARRTPARSSPIRSASRSAVPSSSGAAGSSRSCVVARCTALTSQRPTLGRMIINLDISAGAFISRGNLISVALKFLRLQNDPSMLAVDRLPDRERIRLERFLKGIRICTTHRGEEAKKMTFSACSSGFHPFFIEALLVAATVRDHIDTSADAAQRSSRSPAPRPRTRASSRATARRRCWSPTTSRRPVRRPPPASLTLPDGRDLNFVNLPCVEVRKGVMLPLEICDVLSGQKCPSSSPGSR